MSESNLLGGQFPPLVKMYPDGRYARLTFNPFNFELGLFEDFIRATPARGWIEIYDAIGQFGVKHALDDGGLFLHKVPRKLAPMLALQLIEVAAPYYNNLGTYKNTRKGWKESVQSPLIAWVSPSGKLNHRVSYEQMKDAYYLGDWRLEL